MIVTYQVEDSDITNVKEAIQCLHGLCLSPEEVRCIFEDKEFCQQYVICKDDCQSWEPDSNLVEILNQNILRLLGFDGSWVSRDAPTVDKMAFYGGVWLSALHKNWITPMRFQFNIEFLLAEANVRANVTSTQPFFGTIADIIAYAHENGPRRPLWSYISPTTQQQP